MAGKRNTSIEVWQEVAAAAASQMGLVTRDQLRQLDLSDAGISRAIRTGHLHPVFRGVFRVGHESSAPHVRLLAATMACGPGTVVSHGTAAWLLGLREWRPHRVDVIAPIESGRKIAGIKRRFVPLPAESETIVQAGVPTTSAGRSIVDCAGILRDAGLREMIEGAAHAGALDIPGIDLILAERRRRGGRRLIRLLEPWRRYEPGIRLRSRMEAKLLPLLTEQGLPDPETNAKLRVRGEAFEVDFLWRSLMVVVETDGSRGHDDPAGGARDSHRNRVLIGAGYAVSRLGWEELRDRPDQTMADLARLLATRHQLFLMTARRAKGTAERGRG